MAIYSKLLYICFVSSLYSCLENCEPSNSRGERSMKIIQWNDMWGMIKANGRRYFNENTRTLRVKVRKSNLLTTLSSVDTLCTDMFFSEDTWYCEDCFAVCVFLYCLPVGHSSLCLATDRNLPFENLVKLQTCPQENFSHHN